MSNKKNEFQLSLEENALDFLICGTEYYINGNNHKDLKYAVINIYQAIELFLKARLVKEHWMLIYSKPENCNDDSHTVNLKECIDRLKAINVMLNKNEYQDIIDLSRCRNKLIHHNMNLKITDISDKIGKGIRFLEDFLYNELSIKLENILDVQIYDTLNEIIRSYEERLKKAKEEIENTLPSDKDRLDYHILFCPECEEKTIIYPDNTSKTGCDVHCYLCKNKFNYWYCAKCDEIQFGDSESSVCSDCWRSIIE